MARRRRPARPRVARLTRGRAAVCGAILRALPGWFGIPQAVRGYERDVRRLPVFAARAAGRTVGFLALKRHDRATAEIHVMGVLRAHHRGGFGRALVAAAERWGRRRGVRRLLVRTLSPAHPDRGYAATRRFYRAVGFTPARARIRDFGPGQPAILYEKFLVPGASGEPADGAGPSGKVWTRLVRRT